MSMLSMFGETSSGPIHMGSARIVEGEQPVVPTDWWNGGVVMIYYPGRWFFDHLLTSTFMAQNGMLKAPGDSLHLITVPWRPKRGAVKALPYHTRRRQYRE